MIPEGTNLESCHWLILFGSKTIIFLPFCEDIPTREDRNAPKKNI
jgi:hypothetical protein